MNKKQIFLHSFVVFALVVLTIPQGALAAGNPPRPVSDQQAQNTTPFQQALQQALAQREAEGLPVPSEVEYEYEVMEPAQAPMLRSFSSAPAEQSVTVISTTTIEFDNPQQAGYEEWPELVLNGTANDGDYSALYVQKMEELDPEYWQDHTLGQEPRKYTFTETYEVSYPEPNLLPLDANAAGEQTTSESVLMGFTYTGPHINHTIEQSAEACITTPAWVLWLFPDLPEEQCISIYSFKAGFELDWALGLRLPAEVSMSAPQEMTLGTEYTNLSATLTPKDWSVTDYENWLDPVAVEKGNEFVLRLDFFAGVEGTLLGVVNLCPLLPPLECSKSLYIEKSTSFETPFGEDAYFPIPALEIPIEEWGPSDFLGGDDDDDENNGDENGGGDEDEELDQDDVDEILDELFSLEVGLNLQPQIGSSKITAKWAGEGDCTGEGEVEFTAPGEPASFGPVKACNVGIEDEATISLSEFKYWFNEFLIELGLYMKFSLFGYDLPWFEPLPLLTVDLGKLAGNPAIFYLGDHQHCTSDSFDAPLACGLTLPGNRLELSVPVVDLDAPTSTISTLGLAGNNGWFRSDVQAMLTAEDNPASCGLGVKNLEYSFDNTLWNEYTTPFMITTEGLTTVHHRSLDMADNAEVTKVDIIKLDKTPPLLSGAAVPGPNGYGWNNNDVVVHFTASDAVSGIALVTPDQTLTQEGAGQAVTGTAEDIAGNSSTATVEDINIDKTRPVIIITSPQPGTYANTSTLQTLWTATDALSGIASERGLFNGLIVQNGQTVNLLLVGAGPNSFEVQATDKADNANQSSVSLLVTTDIHGLIAAKEYMCELGWINKPGVCKSLDAKLNAAKAAIARGKPETAINQINAFINELRAQNGKAVEQRAYDVLHADALFVITDLND